MLYFWEGPGQLYSSSLDPAITCSHRTPRTLVFPSPLPSACQPHSRHLPMSLLFKARKSLWSFLTKTTLNTTKSYTTHPLPPRPRHLLLISHQAPCCLGSFAFAALSPQDSSRFLVNFPPHFFASDLVFHASYSLRFLLFILVQIASSHSFLPSPHTRDLPPQRVPSVSELKDVLIYCWVLFHVSH